MIEVWQAEWCPHSGRVRALLTDLQADAIIRQVPPARPDRDAMRASVGTDEIPVVVLEDGVVLSGETDGILRDLARRLGGADVDADAKSPRPPTNEPSDPGDGVPATPPTNPPAAAPEAEDRPLGVPAEETETELPGFPPHEPPSGG